MAWIKTENSKFIEEEVVAVQYLPSNYSRPNAELIIFLRGGGEMKFTNEEAKTLWERFGKQDSEEQK